jgi:hypothetical protein
MESAAMPFAWNRERRMVSPFADGCHNPLLRVNLSGKNMGTATMLFYAPSGKTGVAADDKGVAAETMKPADLPKRAVESDHQDLAFL